MWQDPSCFLDLPMGREGIGRARILINARLPLHLPFQNRGKAEGKQGSFPSHINPTFIDPSLCKKNDYYGATIRKVP